MLNTIKDMINSKEEFLESAQVIYEDVIDDIEKYITEEDDIMDKDDADKTELPKDTVTEDLDDEIDNNEPDDDIMTNDLDDDISLDDPDDDIDETNKSTAPVDLPIGSPTNLNNSDGLDDAIIDDDMGDITNIELRVTTNTLDDVLPVPPMNAADVVDTNTMNIDDGFTESVDFDLGDNVELLDESSNILDDDVDLFTEAITIDSGAEEKKDDEPPKTDEPVKDDSAKDEPSNEVTNAVLDKVAESETDTSVPEDGKEKLLDKLDKLNKSILDLKETVKKHIS